MAHCGTSRVIIRNRLFNNWILFWCRSWQLFWTIKRSQMDGGFKFNPFLARQTVRLYRWSDSDSIFRWLSQTDRHSVNPTHLTFRVLPLHLSWMEKYKYRSTSRLLLLTFRIVIRVNVRIGSPPPVLLGFLSLTSLGLSVCKSKSQFVGISISIWWSNQFWSAPITLSEYLTLNGYHELLRRRLKTGKELFNSWSFKRFISSRRPLIQPNTSTVGKLFYSILRSLHSVLVRWLTLLATKGVHSSFPDIHYIPQL